MSSDGTGDGGREWQDVALEFEGTRETTVNARDREEAVEIAKRELREDLEPVAASVGVRSDICYVCGDPIPDEYGKYDPKAPVYDEDMGGAYHLGCESEVFDEIHASLHPDTHQEAADE